MILELYPILVILLSFYIRKSLGCDQHIHKNLTCNDIKTDDGYQYLYNGSMANQIYVTFNQTLIAHAVIKEQSFDLSPEVIRMDNNSVTTRHCRDLDIKYMIDYGTRSVKEICVDYKITEMTEPRIAPLQGPSLGLIGGIICGVIAFILIGLLWWFLSWKREVKTQQGPATVSSFLRYPLTKTCFRTIPKPQAGSEETGLGEMHFEPDPRGRGEEVEEVDALEGVTVDNIDPAADGTAESRSLDHNLSNGEIQTPKNGETGTPDVGASDLQAMNRNQRDDPGGVKNNKGKDTAQSREMSNGWAHPKDHESEGQPLLSSQRAAIQQFDMTGEATALVNKSRIDPYQVSRCSAEPDADVESTSNMNNCAHSR